MEGAQLEIATPITGNFVIDIKGGNALSLSRSSFLCSCPACLFYNYQWQWPRLEYMDVILLFVISLLKRFLSSQSF